MKKIILVLALLTLTVQADYKCDVARLELNTKYFGFIKAKLGNRENGIKMTALSTMKQIKKMSSLCRLQGYALQEQIERFNFIRDNVNTKGLGK